MPRKRSTSIKDRSFGGMVDRGPDYGCDSLSQKCPTFLHSDLSPGGKLQLVACESNIHPPNMFWSELFQLGWLIEGRSPMKS